jgi:TolB-like protein
MGRTMHWTGAVTALALAAPLAAQEGRTSFALLPFENSGSYGQDKESFSALELGIPAALAASLAEHPGARVVEPAVLRRSLRAKQPDVSQHIDARTAAEVAKEAGARYAVTGSFADFYGKFRINARVIDAQSGEILKVVSNDDRKLQDRAQLGTIVQLVAERIVAAAGLPPLPTGSATRRRALPANALTEYGRGLMFEDQGDRAKAAEAYQRALSAYPDYAEARAGLARVR